MTVKDKINGRHVIYIYGQPYVLRYTWGAIAEVLEKYGEKPNFLDPRNLASIAAIGMREHHPDMTEDKIMQISPPLIPFARSVQDALHYAYFGPEQAPAEAEEAKKKTGANGLLRRIRKLCHMG